MSMLANRIYKKLSDTIGGLERSPDREDVWARVKAFAAEFNCHHCLALDNERLAGGLTNALLYSDAPPDVCATIDRERLHVDHPFETYARASCLPFLVSEVRRDGRFQGQRWSEVLSDTLRDGDGVVTPIRANGGLVGAAIFGGREIKDSPVARSSLLVVAHAAFDRLDAIITGAKPQILLLLTQRELDCLQMLARGLPDDDVAQALGISRRTVRYHVDHAKQKLGVSSRVHAVAAAVNRGLISL